MLIASRVKDMFNLFAHIIPIKPTKAENKALKKALGIEADEFIKTVFINLGHDICKKENLEAGEGYLDWISEAILYMKGERDEYPNMKIAYDAGDEAKTSVK